MDVKWGISMKEVEGEGWPGWTVLLLGSKLQDEREDEDNDGE